MEIELEDIKRYVENYFNVDDIGVISRKRPLPYLRWANYKIAKTYTKKTLEEIGNACGGRDHATVVHALKTYDPLTYAGMEQYRECVKFFRSYLDENWALKQEDVKEGSACLSAYIEQLQKDARWNMEDVSEKIKVEIPWYEKYKELSVDDQVRFDLWAEAKLKFL